MSKISWLQLLDLVDEQMKELNRNDLNVSESNINNIAPQSVNISDEELLVITLLILEYRGLI